MAAPQQPASPSSSSERIQMEMTTNDETAGSSTSGNNFNPMDYKTMTSVLKTYTKETDAVLGKLCDLSVKFGENMSKLAAIIDPEVNAILYKKSKDEPDCISVSQQRGIPIEEINAKYSDMCDALDKRVTERYINENEK